jgi:hypothetical protein
MSREDYNALKNMEGKKLKTVDFEDGETSRFNEYVTLTFEDGTVIQIAYVCYPEGSNWLTVEKKD